MATPDCNEEWGLPPMKHIKLSPLTESQKSEVKLGFDTLFHEMDNKRANKKEELEKQIDQQIYDEKWKFLFSKKKKNDNHDDYGTQDEICRNYRLPKEMIPYHHHSRLHRLKICNLCKLIQQVNVIKIFIV